MANDVLIAPGDGPSPQAYEVPNATEVIPKAITATFDGTAAAGNFVPAVQIISDGGVLVAEVATDTTVTAGSSATVSFFPGGEVGVSSGGGTDPLAVHFNTSPQSNSFLEVETTVAGLGVLLNATNGGAFAIEASGSAATSQVAVTADAQVFLASPTLTNHIDSGGFFEVQNSSSVDLLRVDENGSTTIQLSSGKSLVVNDHLGSPILRVDEGGGGAPGYHIKTGGAWVADL